MMDTPATLIDTDFEALQQSLTTLGDMPDDAPNSDSQPPPQLLSSYP